MSDELKINTLLIEDNLGDAFLVKQLLVNEQEAQFHLSYVSHLDSAIKILQQEKFKVILLDLSLPDSQGIETLLKLVKQAPDTPILVLTGVNDRELGVQSVQQGAQDYLVKGQINTEILIRSIYHAIERAKLKEKLRQQEEQLQKFNQELQRKVEERTAEMKKQNEELQCLLTMAKIDKLTGIANRYSFEELLEQEWKNAIRNSTLLSIIMIDLDFFKLFNDIYGHQKGDDCLRQVAQTIKKALKRPKDLLARYGGEEFLGILPNTDRSGATVVAESMRSMVKALNIPHATSKVSDRVTLSLGIATTIPQRDSKPEVLIAKADKALYLAKQKGRDRIEAN